MEHLEREQYLHDALRQDKKSLKKFLTIHDRFLINQERGYLLSIGGEEELPYQKISYRLEDKIERNYIK